MESREAGKTFYLWAQSWLKLNRAGGVKRNTLRFYAHHVNVLIDYCQTQDVTDPYGLTLDVMLDYMLYLQEHHNPGGVKGHMQVARTFLLWLEGQLPDWSNPAHKVKVASVPFNPLKPVPFESVEAMLNTCKNRSFADYRDKAMMLVLYDTGARATETLMCDRSDYDQISGRLYITHTKTGMVRKNLLNDITRRAIKAYLNQRCDSLPCLWVNLKCSGRLGYTGLLKMIKHRAKLAGVPETTPHAFRRGHATESRNAGAESSAIRHRIGHSSSAVLERYLDPEDEEYDGVYLRTSPVNKLRK